MAAVWRGKQRDRIQVRPGARGMSDDYVRESQFRHGGSVNGSAFIPHRDMARAGPQTQGSGLGRSAVLL